MPYLYDALKIKNIFLIISRLKIYLIIFILLCSVVSVSSQNFIEGYVKDKKNNTPVQYVNIGIIGKNIGTVSQNNGFFRMIIEDKYFDDSLRFSILGYKSITVKVYDFLKEFKNNQLIFMEPELVNLKEVIVSAKGLKEAILGNKTESKVMQAGFSSNELGNEVGIVIKIKKKPTYIENFNVSISENKYDTVKFRINIYTLKDGLPYENLLKQSVIVQTTIKKGKLSIDLRKYNIIVEEDFFAALEWIEDLGKNGLYFSASFSGSSIIARQTSQGTWEKPGPISLGISVGVKY